MGELVDPADSKSAASDGVSVRLRLSLPNTGSVAELVDAPDLKFVGRNTVRVRLPPEPPN